MTQTLWQPHCQSGKAKANLAAQKETTPSVDGRDWPYRSLGSATGRRSPWQRPRPFALEPGPGRRAAPSGSRLDG